MVAPAVLLAAGAPSDLTLLARVVVAAAAGLVVGWERDLRNRVAGGRTFGLMATGAAVFTVSGVAFPGEAGRVIAGVATGIGFIGAGLVWRGHANDVHGLTTAAAIWAMVAVGVLPASATPRSRSASPSSSCCCWRSRSRRSSASSIRSGWPAASAPSRARPTKTARAEGRASVPRPPEGT